MNLAKSIHQQQIEDVLRSFAFHEAAHVIICNHLGGVSAGRILTNSDIAMQAGAPPWSGLFTIFASPDSSLMDEKVRIEAGLLRARPDWRALVGLAGPVVDLLLEVDTETTVDRAISHVSKSIANCSISPADLSMLEYGWQDSVPQLLRMLTAFLDQIQDESARILINSRVVHI